MGDSWSRFLAIFAAAFAAGGGSGTLFAQSEGEIRALARDEVTKEQRVTDEKLKRIEGKVDDNTETLKQVEDKVDDIHKALIRRNTDR